MELPFSEACERNKGPILEVLRKVFSKTESVLEIGSGTGQHAVHFSKHLPHLVWQPTELGENVAMLKSRIDLEGPGNLLPAKELDVLRNNWELKKNRRSFHRERVSYCPNRGHAFLFQRNVKVSETFGDFLCLRPLSFWRGVHQSK